MTSTPPPEHRTLVQTLLETIEPSDFDVWYEERQFAENIRSGKPYLNTPPPVKPANQHSPSQLNQCHRKIFYRQLNAPEEAEDPDGIFWTGTKFEEEIVMPYLSSVVGNRAYVRNSMWVDYTVETDVGDIRIRGSTDPVVVDAQSAPILPTEVKTKDSIENTTTPNPHHVAQLLAYMEGLSREWETEIRTGLIIYGDRTTLSIKTFEVEFDRKRWGELVLEWATEHTEFRLDEQLPPADPVFDWECNFCSFRKRCGQAEAGFQDEGATGFLPGVTYPREKAKSYIQSHSDARLTPTLAVQHPDLGDRYGVFDWRCEVESHHFDVAAIDWDGDATAYPVCPSCASEGTLSELVEPHPEKQHQITSDGSGGATR